MSRREFVVAGPLALGASALGIQESQAVHPGFPSQDPAKVKEVVGASHARFDRVKELVGASPALAKASWDWGFGDWETALGAASHVGNREIALFLVEHGARPDIFYHAMMGHLEAVKAAVTAQPGIQKIHGPHGITLMAHAKAGGEEAAAVVEFLEKLEGSDVRQENRAISDAEKEVYIGKYAYGKGGGFIVDKSRQGWLWIRRTDEEFGRILNRVEEHGFAPAGAPKVVIRFKVENGKASSLTVHDPGPVLMAVREG